MEQEIVNHITGYPGIFLAAADDFMVWGHMVQFTNYAIKIIMVMGFQI
jgi:hypothetical protein